MTPQPLQAQILFFFLPQEFNMAAALLASIPQPHSVHRIGGPIQDDTLMSVCARVCV